MEEVIYYKTTDGQIFEDESECLQYEKELITNEIYYMLYPNNWLPIYYTIKLIGGAKI